MISPTTSAPLISFDEKIQDTLLPAAIYRWIKTRKFSRNGEKELDLVPFLANANRVAIDIGANKGAGPTDYYSNVGKFMLLSPIQKWFGAWRNVLVIKPVFLL